MSTAKAPAAPSDRICEKQTRTHTNLHIHTNTRTHTDTHAYTYKHTHTNTHATTHKHTHTYKHTYIQTHIYTHKHTRTHTNKHILELTHGAHPHWSGIYHNYYNMVYRGHYMREI